MNIQEIVIISIVIVAALWYGRTFFKQFTRQKSGCRKCSCYKSDEPLVNNISNQSQETEI
jgi:hypothetical protein